MNNTWTNLQDHNVVRIKFTLFKIDNWDNTFDYVKINIDQNELFKKVFDNSEVGSF